VYFADDRPFTDAARVRALVWSYGPDAAGSALTAAWWHGFSRFCPGIVDVTVPRSSNGRVHPGSRVRRRDLVGDDVVLHRGLRVTAAPLTVIEAAVRIRGGAKIMDSALQRDVQLRQLWRAHLRNKGRYGSPAARILLQAADDGAHSEAERLFVKLLEQAGITGWRTNYPVGGYVVDVAFLQSKLAVEIDGLAFHSESEDFHRDRLRQNDITLLGWQVLRFTWLDLVEYPDRVIATVRAAISA
jgi:very-short-patch-repair endonuclease